MHIAIALFPHFTATDAIGPYEVLSRLPHATVQFVSSAGGLVTSDTGFLSIDTIALANAQRPDILVMPGGPSVTLPFGDARLLDWLRACDAHTTWTASVCTGSLVLGAAGLLQGVRSTTHWAELASLTRYGAIPTAERVVIDGKRISGAGVSAGFDMALALAARIAGDDVAMAIQLGIEYDPQPPFDAGSPHKAPAHVLALVKAKRALRDAAALKAAS
jgi:transcriptional regulator GlxA family with amidase domain